MSESIDLHSLRIERTDSPDGMSLRIARQPYIDFIDGQEVIVQPPEHLTIDLSEDQASEYAGAVLASGGYECIEYHLDLPEQHASVTITNQDTDESSRHIFRRGDVVVETTIGRKDPYLTAEFAGLLGGGIAGETLAQAAARKKRQRMFDTFDGSDEFAKEHCLLSAMSVDYACGPTRPHHLVFKHARGQVLLAVTYDDGSGTLALLHFNAERVAAILAGKDVDFAHGHGAVSAWGDLTITFGSIEYGTGGWIHPSRTDFQEAPSA